jgi:hypothetical protein
VFAPRGTSYTPKWSIVVLALACLGVLKFNDPRGKPAVAREPPAAAPFLPTVENKTIPEEFFGWPGAFFPVRDAIHGQVSLAPAIPQLLDRTSVF